MLGKRFIIFTCMLSLLVIICYAGDVRCETMTTDPHDYLHLNFGEDDIYLRTTVDNADTVAQIDFTMYFAAEVPDGQLKRIDVYRYYDPQVLSFPVDSYEVNTEEWNGTFELVVDENPRNNGLNRIHLSFDDAADPDKDAPDHETKFATLHLVLNCMNPDNEPFLISYDDADESIVEVGIHQYTPGLELCPGCEDEGEVTVKDYSYDLEIKDSIYECSILGKDISRPGIMTANFRIAYIRHRITFDHSKLSYDAASTEIYDQSLWDMGKSEIAHYPGIQSNIDTLVVILWPYDDDNGTPPLDNDTLYILAFTGEYNHSGYWAASTDIAIEQDESYVKPFYRHSMLYHTCPQLTAPNNGIIEDNGTITSPQHTAVIKVINDCSVCDKLIMTATDGAIVMMQMQSNFVAGGAVERVNVVTDYGRMLAQDGNPSPQSNITFSNTYYSDIDELGYIDHSVLVSKQNNEGLFDCRTQSDGFGDLLKLYVQLNQGAWPLFISTYAARKLNIDLLSTITIDGNPYYSRVTDEYGNKTLSVGDGLSLTDGEVEVSAVEFSTTSKTQQSVVVSHDLRIRNNFDVDTFSVTVDLGSSSLWCIHCVLPESNIDVVTDLAGKTYTIRATSAFSQSANGDAYTKIATIWYGIPNNCIGTQYYTVTPNIKFGMAKNSSGQSSYATVYSKGFVKGKCNYGGGCGAAIPVACAGSSGNGSKLFDESAETNNSLFPTRFNLYPNRPNPFNPTTIIAYDVPVASHVTIEVINMLGQRVATLVDEMKVPGRYEVTWNAVDEQGYRVASGIYLYNMRAGDYIQTNKMILMK